MKFEVNIEKRYFYLILSVIIVSAGVLVVAAYNPTGAGGVPSTFGHSIDEIDWTKTIPSAKITNLNSTKICIGTDCKTVWPADGGTIDNVVWFGNQGILLKDGAQTSVASCSYTTGTTCYPLAYAQSRKDNGQIQTRAWTAGCDGYCDGKDSGWVTGTTASVSYTVGSVNCMATANTVMNGVSLIGPCTSSQIWQ